MPLLSLNELVEKSSAKVILGNFVNKQKSYSCWLIVRSRERRCSPKKGFLINFTKFTEKHPWCVPGNFAKFLRTTFLQNTSRRLLLYSFRKMFFILTLSAPCISESCTKTKINLHFYFHTSLWYLKRFYEGLKGLHKTFWGTTKRCENKNLSWFFSLLPGLGRKGLSTSMMNFWSSFYYSIMNLNRFMKLVWKSHSVFFFSQRPTHMSEIISGNWNPFKNYENYFLKALFVIKTFKFLSWLFWSYRKTIS